MKCKICFIDGNDLKYKIFKTEAKSEEDAMDRFNERYGAEFDHQFISIEEESKLIEKFTPEELAQIRKELREKNRFSQKNKLLRDQFGRAVRVLDFRKDLDMQSSFSAYDVKVAPSLLVDHALKNYVINERHRSATNRTTYKRNPLIPGELEGKYLAAYTKLVDVLEEVSVPWEG